jgi:epoxyqueuosine reductase QueG
VPLSECKIIKNYLLERECFTENANVIMILLPYRSRHQPKNLSVYASVRDYHKYVENLRAEVIEYVKTKHPVAKIQLFADHSPIDEVHAACVSGLGFIGRNGLLINERYSSFVFLCEIVTDLSPKELGIEEYTEKSVSTCMNCGACAKLCPSNCMDEGDPHPKSECLSAITQKKGELTDKEIKMMLENSSIWGCDVCQNVCPYTKKAEFTPISYFNEGVITELDTSTLDNMTDEEFMSRPFSWRGRGVIRRNTQIYDQNKN